MKNKNISNLIEIIGIANNGEVAIDVIKKLKPDILLLDLKMPKFNGIEVIERTKEYSITTMIITGETYMINKIRLTVVSDKG